MWQGVADRDPVTGCREGVLKRFLTECYLHEKAYTLSLKLGAGVAEYCGNCKRGKRTILLPGCTCSQDFGTVRYTVPSFTV